MKLIASSGDVVTNVGKKIASSAQLIPAGHHKSHFAKLSGGSSHSHTGTGHSESRLTKIFFFLVQLIKANQLYSYANQ